VEIHQYWAEINGLKLHYQHMGDGTPVILVHGLLGGAFCWRCNIPAFSERHSVFAVELPGFGLSDASPETDCSMEAQALRLLGLIEKLQFESVDVVASSWGGAVALFLAARSRKVRSLVLAAPVNPWSNFGAERIRFLSSRIGGCLLRMAIPLSSPFHRIALRRMYGDPDRIPEGTLQGYAPMLMRRGRVHNLLNVLRSWESDMRALRGAIAQVRVPVLLVWGTKDGAVDLRSADDLRRILPHCEMALLPGVGHLPFEENPEGFDRLVLDFLARSA
jgi:4,5:9,10-diseco-3-hydroxy-5,9,17-trioxoandrosta-1(10),2-diene-4-oate hydrolase